MDIGSMDFFERVLYFIQNYGSSFLEGAEIAAFLAVAGTALGCLIGFLAGAVSALEIERMIVLCAKQCCASRAQ